MPLDSPPRVPARRPRLVVSLLTLASALVLASLTLAHPWSAHATTLASPTGAASSVIPIGAGPWTTLHLGAHVQTCEGGTISGSPSSGSATFTLPNAPNGHPGGGACGNHATRAEWQMDSYPDGGNHYTGGIHQMSGTFTINSMNGTRLS